MVMAGSSVCAIPVWKEQLAVSLHGADSHRNFTLPQEISSLDPSQSNTNDNTGKQNNQTNTKHEQTKAASLQQCTTERTNSD